MGILDAPSITTAQAATYVTAANTAASNALASAQTATQQAAVVAAANRIYATTAAGISATTNGQYFYVPAGVSGESLLLYLNSSGTATLISTLPDYTGVSSTVLATPTGLPTLRPSLFADFASSDLQGPVSVSRVAPGFKVSRAMNLTSTAGSSANAGRFDHDPVVASSLGLLLEDSYAQLLHYTEDLTQAMFVKSGTTLGPAYNPLGTGITLTEIVNDTSTGVHSIVATGSSMPVVAVGSKYTISVFGAANAYNEVTFTIGLTGDFSTIVTTTFNFTTGVFSATTGMLDTQAIQYKNGVWRVIFQTSAATNTSNLVITSAILNGSGASSYTGDGVSGLYLGGFNVTSSTTTLATTYPSYVYADGTAITRDPDVATVILGDWFNSVQGTFLMEHDCASGIPLLSTNSSTILTSAGTGRIALTYTKTGTAVVQAGGAPTTTASGITFGTNLTLIPTGRGVAHCRRFIYYPVALTTLQIQQLTSV
jgi:hypothetical protein